MDKSPSVSFKLSFFLSFLFLSPFLSVGDERAPSQWPQKILFVVPVPQCEMSLFKSGHSIKVAQKPALQCKVKEEARDLKGKGRKKDRGEERGAEEVRGKNG